MAESLKVCTFRLDDLYCGVPVDEVQEVIPAQEMTRVPLAPAAVRGLINLRGRIVPVLDLRRALGLGEAPAGLARMNLVAGGAEAVSFLVDDVGEVAELPAASFEPAPPTLRGPVRALVRGVCPLPGRLLLLLDARRAAAVNAAAAEAGGEVTSSVDIADAE